MSEGSKKKLLPRLQLFTGKMQERSDTRATLNSICNWTNPDIIVRASSCDGDGVFSTAPIAKGALVIVYGGRVLTQQQLALLPSSLDMVVQVEESLFFVPADLDSLGIGERINHSCEPNVGFGDQMSLVAMRDINPGEEITMDYAICDARESFSFKCNCGRVKCRGRVSGNDWKLLDVQERLLDYFQPFLYRRVLAQRRIRKVSNI